MSAKTKPAAPVAAVAVITGAELLAKTHDLPLAIAQALDKTIDAEKAYTGTIQNLALTIDKYCTENMDIAEEWCLVEKGDPSEDAEPVHELAEKVRKYYEAKGHSNGSAVWTAAKDYAKALLNGEEITTKKRGVKGKIKDSVTFLIGNGSYEYGKNDGAAVKMFRRIALDTAGKKANESLRKFQTKLGEAMAELGFNVAELKGAPPKTKKAK